MCESVSHRSYSWILVALGLLLCQCGCVPSVPTGTVTGKVTFKDAPVPEGCLISFIADTGYAALGTANKAGEYELMFEGKKQVPAASYRVAVTVPGVQGPEMTDEDERQFMAGDPATIAKFSQKVKKPNLPEKYTDFNQSGLIFEIKSGSNIYNIDLQ